LFAMALMPLFVGCATTATINRPLHEIRSVVETIFIDQYNNGEINWDRPRAEPAVTMNPADQFVSVYRRMVPGCLWDDVLLQASGNTIRFAIAHYCEMCGAATIRARTTIELVPLRPDTTQCKVSSKDHGFIFSTRRADREVAIIQYLGTGSPAVSSAPSK
jgi:hypothetical protein